MSLEPRVNGDVSCCAINEVTPDEPVAVVLATVVVLVVLVDELPRVALVEPKLDAAASAPPDAKSPPLLSTLLSLFRLSI